MEIGVRAGCGITIRGLLLQVISPCLIWRLLAGHYSLMARLGQNLGPKTFQTYRAGRLRRFFAASFSLISGNAGVEIHLRPKLVPH